MNDEEKQLRDAFLAIDVPTGLNEKTLAYIESKRTSSQEGRTMQQQTSVKPAVRARRGGKFRVVAALVACFCLVFAGMGGYAYATPSAFVSVEAPVGMALRVNCFDIVVGVESFDGNDLNGLTIPVDVVGKSYSEALDIIAQANQTFVTSGDTSDNAAIDISITSNNEQQVQSLQRDSENCMNAHGMHGHCQSATHEERQAAIEEGMGVARYLAAQELLTLDSSLTLEDCREMSMAELRSHIASLGGDAPEMDSSVGCAMGDGGAGCSGGDEELTASESHGHGNGYGYGKGNGAGGHGMHNGRMASGEE